MRTRAQHVVDDVTYALKSVHIVICTEIGAYKSICTKIGAYKSICTKIGAYIHIKIVVMHASKINPHVYLIKLEVVVGHLNVINSNHCH